MTIPLLRIVPLGSPQINGLTLQELGNEVLKVRRKCPYPNSRKSRLDSSNSKHGLPTALTGTEKTDHYQQLFLEKAVLAHGYSFKWIEDEGNWAILSYLKDSGKTISAAIIEAELLKLHQKMEEKVKCDLEKVSSRICLTAYFWTSCSKRDYLCLSAHYVNEDWELNSNILNFSVALFPNFANVLGDRIYCILKEWAIEKMIFSLTIDNACSMGDMQEMLCEQLKQQDALLCQGKFFHIASCAHIFDLTVEDSLKVIDDM